MTIKNKEATLKKNFLIILGMLLVFYPYLSEPICKHHPYGCDVCVFCQLLEHLVHFLGVLSLGHAVFLGIGAYISSCLFLYADVSPWFGMLVGGLIVAVLSIVIGFATFRMRGPYFTLTTIAMGEMIRVWVETNDYFLGIDIKGSRGLLLPSKGESFLNLEFSNKLGYYYVILAMLVLVLIISHLILKSRLGYYMTAIKSDETAAESLGIVPLRYKLIGIALSSFLISLGGTFYAHYYYINPTRIFGSDLSVQIALIALIGGQGKVLGPVFGAVLLIPISELLAMLFGGQLPGLHLFVYGIALMLCVRYLPDGIHDLIIGFFQKVQAKLFRERN